MNKINSIKNIPPNTYLVTMDSKSLYTSILKLEETAAIKNIWQLSKEVDCNWSNNRICGIKTYVK